MALKKTPTYGQDSTEEAILQGQAEGSTMPYRRRLSESRVRENRMHGLMREDWSSYLWTSY